MEQSKVIEIIDIVENKNGTSTVVVGPNMAGIILFIARKKGIRGSCSKSARIRKKVLTKTLNELLKEYIEENK